MRQFIGVMVMGGLVGGASLGAWAQTPNNTGSIFTCVDKQGRRLTADRPIAECVDREQRELSPSGTVRRQIGPTLTEQERADLDAQRRKDAEERIRLQEERRRERALMIRYPDKAAHDAERAEAIHVVEEVIAAAEKRLVDLQKQRKALDTEMEFYQRNPEKAPATLRRKIADNDKGVEEQKRFIANQDAEKRRIHQRFDAELTQLRKVWADLLAPAAAAASTPAPAVAR